MSYGQCAVSKHLAYRHILKSIVKKLEQKNQKFSCSKLNLSLSVHMQSAVQLPPTTNHGPQGFKNVIQIPMTPFLFLLDQEIKPSSWWKPNVIFVHKATQR